VALPNLSSMPPCAEEGLTFQENAILKATYYSMHTPGLLFADDSGLEVGSLGGAPGVHSARYAGSDEANNRLLLERMHGIDHRAARFVCVIALADRGSLVKTFRGDVEGQILHEPRGSKGFGYDPLFFYPPFGRSFGEISAEQKMEVSHRGRALRLMLEYPISGLL